MRHRVKTDVNSDLFEACAAGNLREAKRALRNGANVNFRNMTEPFFPLSAAAIGNTPGHVEIVKLLCEENNADEAALDQRGDTALQAAKHCSRHEIVAYLGIPKEKRPKRRHRSKKKNENLYVVTGDELLRDAARLGDDEEVRRCMAEGAHVSSRNAFGATALHLAVAGNHCAVVSMLVNEFGADVDMCKNWGDTPLHWAAAEGHVIVTRLLVQELGARVDLPNQAGNTPLHVAAYHGHLEVCEVLKEELGADVLQRNRLGKFPMDMAESSDAEGTEEVAAWFRDLPEHVDDDDEEEEEMMVETPPPPAKPAAHERKGR